MEVNVDGLGWIFSDIFWTAVEHDRAFYGHGRAKIPCMKYKFCFSSTVVLSTETVVPYILEVIVFAFY